MKSAQDSVPENSREPVTRDYIGKPANSDSGGSAAGDPRLAGLTIWQHRRGYRFGLDALLLATDLGHCGVFALEVGPSDAPAAPTPCVVELGAAQGIVSLCVARQYPHLEVVAVERQEALFGLLEQNIEQNQLQQQVRALRLDIRDIRADSGRGLPAHSADLVLCNPPYFKKGERRPSANPERAAARHELHGGLGDFVDAARYILKQRGRLKIILPPIRLAELLSCIEGTDLAMETMRFFHSRADSDAYLVESVLRRGGAPDMRVRAPLFIYQNADDYSDEVRRRVDGAAALAEPMEPQP